MFLFHDAALSQALSFPGPCIPPDLLILQQLSLGLVMELKTWPCSPLGSERKLFYQVNSGCPLALRGAEEAWGLTSSNAKLCWLSLPLVLENFWQIKQD